jgi:branched-chain amino acid transport system ATP-binding protein
VSLLEVQDLDCRYGLLQAVRGVSLSVEEGETVALIGANGAGKTTLLRAIAGAHQPHGGRVALAGTDITTMPAHTRVKRGIALVPEGRRLFASLTVDENLRVAARSGTGSRWNVQKVIEIFPFLKARLHMPAATLSGGEQQAVAIGRALMTNPRLLLLDEASLGLAPVAVEAVYRSLADVIKERTTVLLVEQDLARALKVADRVICMLEGRVVLEGAAKSLDRDRIVNAYFGLRRAAAGGAGA